MEGLNLRRNAGAAAAVAILLVAALAGGIYVDQGRLVIDPVNGAETLAGMEGPSIPRPGVELGGLSPGPALQPGNSTNVSGVRVTLERAETAPEVASVNSSDFNVVAPPEGAQSLVLVVSTENVGEVRTTVPSAAQGNSSDFAVNYAGKEMATPPGGPVIEGERVRFNSETLRPYDVAPREEVFPGVERRGVLVFWVPEEFDLQNATLSVDFEGESGEWRLAGGK